MKKRTRKAIPHMLDAPIVGPVLVNRQSGKVASVSKARLTAIKCDVIEKAHQGPLVGIETVLAPNGSEAKKLEQLMKCNQVVRKPLRTGGRLPERQRVLGEDDALWDAIRKAYCDAYPRRPWPTTDDHLAGWLQEQIRKRKPPYDTFRGNRFSALLGDDDADGNPQLAHGERWWRDRSAARRKNSR